MDNPFVWFALMVIARMIVFIGIFYTIYENIHCISRVVHGKILALPVLVLWDFCFYLAWRLIFVDYTTDELLQYKLWLLGTLIFLDGFVPSMLYNFRSKDA